MAVLGQGTAGVLFRPAAQAHTRAAVGSGPALTSANTLNASTAGVVTLAAPPVGGLVFGLFGIEAVAGAAVGASLVSAACIVRMSVRVRERGRPQHVLADLRDGLDHLRRTAVARGLLVTNGVYLLANAALTALLVPFGVTRLGGSLQVGYLLSALGLGFLVGAPLSKRWADRFGVRTAVAGGQVLVAAAFALMFNASSLPVAAVLLGVPGVSVVVAVQTWLQRDTPEDLLGRVSAAFLTVEAAVTLAGALAGPALSEIAGLPVALNTACAVTLLSALITFWLVPREAAVELT